MELNDRNATEILIFFKLISYSPISTIFPYTTLFRSPSDVRLLHRALHPGPARPRGAQTVFFLGEALFLSSSRSRRTGMKRSEEHTSELQSRENLVCRLLLEKKKQNH